MALPKLNTQTFELTVPSTDEKIKFRPFLVKEEKILLQAQEGGQSEMMDAVADVVVTSVVLPFLTDELVPTAAIVLGNV